MAWTLTRVQRQKKTWREGAKKSEPQKRQIWPE